MESRKIQITVGFFLLVVICAVLFLCFKVANTASVGDHASYRIYAIFDNVGGLKARSPIKIGGVVVGRVHEISLAVDEDAYKPYVSIDIERQYNRILSSSALSIKTSGLLGEQYIAIALGINNRVIDEIDSLDARSPTIEKGTAKSVPDYFQEGFVVHNTKSAIALEDLIGQFLYRSD